MRDPQHSSSRRRGAHRPNPRSSHGPAPKSAHSSIAPLHPTLEPPDIKSFGEWPLGDQIQGAIAGMNITVPTPIQRLAIQPVLDGRDVIAKAETGTGKTLAFGAPMISKIDPARASVLGLVLCPTRELAQQDAKVLEILGAARGVKVALIVGGDPMGPQVDALKAGAQVVVGTPGRILDLYKQRFLSFPWTEFAILDEADVMLEIGFIDDVKMILSYTPDERQTLLFSATFPPELLKLAREYTKDPVEIATAAGISTVDAIEQGWMRVDDDDRALALIRLIEQSAKDDVLLVFCDRRTEVDKLMRRLERLPYSIKALHGGYDQAARFRVMSAFRTGEVKTLVATDVASRGLDVTCVTHVVNFGSPQDLTDYTHRIGRTGRAGRKGRAITLVGPGDMRRWNPILREATWAIPEVEPPRSSHAARFDAGPRGSRGRSDRARPARHDQAEMAEAPRTPESTGNARSDRRAWPVDGEAPRSAEAVPSRSSRSPRTPRATRAPSSSRPRPQDPLDRRPADMDVGPSSADSRWPADEHAYIEGSRPRDLRPNRASPPAASGSAPRSAPREERAPRREDRPAPSTARSPRPDARAPRSGEAHSPGEARSPGDTRPAGDRGRPGDRERTGERRNDRHAVPSGEEPRRETRPAARPGPDARAPRPSSDRASSRPPRDESRRPERSPRPDRNSRENPPATEERPPGTFERPMHGGLLGHAAHRPVPPKTSDEHGEGRGGGPGRRGGRPRGPRREPRG